MSRHVRIRLLLAAAVVVIAGAVWLAGAGQRSAANGSFGEIEAAHGMLLSMLDQEDGFNSYLATGRASSLARYERGRRGLETALARSEATQKEPEELLGIRRQRVPARRWQEAAEAHLTHVAAGGESRLPRAEADELDRHLRRFRLANTELRKDLDEERVALQERAVDLTVALILIISALFATVGFFAFDRRARRRQLREAVHSRFADALQLARSETEAFAVVRRYLERLVPGGTATILSRNNSANRLESRSPVEDPVLVEALDGAEPESCLAIRGGRTHRRTGSAGELIGCEICGARGRRRSHTRSTRPASRCAGVSGRPGWRGRTRARRHRAPPGGPDPRPGSATQAVRAVVAAQDRGRATGHEPLEVEPDHRERLALRARQLERVREAGVHALAELPAARPPVEAKKPRCEERGDHRIRATVTPTARAWSATRSASRSCEARC